MIKKKQEEEKEGTANSKARTERNLHYVSRSGLMSIPEDISLNHIHSSVFGLLNKIRPHLQPTQNKKPT
jgi:uncharacterized pyridoxal phosphate-containing UPF0001 family protein